MRVVFELRKEKVNSSGLAPIQFVVRINGIRIRRNVGESVMEKYWDGNRVKPNLKKEPDNNYLRINQVLQNTEKKIQGIFLYFETNEITVTKELFLEKLEIKEDLPSTSEPDFFKCFEEFLLSNKLTKAANTVKGQKSVYVFLKNFEEDEDFEIKYSNLDGYFFENLSRYAFLERKTKNNYFAKIVAVIKTFMRWSIKKGYTTSRYFEDFKATEHDIDIVYLTFDELMLLHNHEFESRRLEHVKDFYCMGCFTGLRFSDLYMLHLANISEEHIIASIQKTRTQNHAIKLNKFSKAILEKYKGTIYEPLPRISSQKLNDYIKECCEIVGINQDFTIHWFVGAEKRTLTQPKYKFITSHTARKTFITNSLLLGMEPKAIKKIANIKKDAVLDKYMKVTQAFTDTQMEDTWDKM